MISWLLGDIMYWLALAALGVGTTAYILSYFVGFIPMLKAHAMILRIVGFVLVLLGGFYVSDHHGYQRRVAEDQAEIDRLNGEARAKEAELNTKLARATSQLKQAKNDIKAKQSSISVRIDSGELRIPSTCGVQTSSSTSSAGGDQADGSDATKQALKDIAAIAADGDTAITQLNACIATYNQVRETINVKP
jgi:hypothetical protein